MSEVDLKCNGIAPPGCNPFRTTALPRQFPVTKRTDEPNRCAALTATRTNDTVARGVRRAGRSGTLGDQMDPQVVLSGNAISAYARDGAAVELTSRLPDADVDGT